MVVLNRAALPSLSDDERALLSRLSEGADASGTPVSELLLAGRWEAGRRAPPTPP